MSKLSITITGDLGSGKSSIAKELCRMLDYRYFSTGTIQRQIGKERGMNTLELNYFSEKNEDIDKYIDDQVVKLNEEKEPYVLDSRMAWHFIEKSFKIYFTANPLIAAQRVNSDKQRDNEPLVEDLNHKSLNLLERRAAEDKRFKIKYGVDCSDMNNFDLVIDTTVPNIEEISKAIFKLYSDYSKNGSINKYWVSPKILYPTHRILNSGHEETKTLNQFAIYEGSSDSGIVETIKLNKDIFMWNGQKRVSASILSKIPLIPITIIAKDEEEIQSGIRVVDFIQKSYNVGLLHEWEDVHGFRFMTYPVIKQNSI